MGFLANVLALLGVSAYQALPSGAPSIDDAAVKAMRKAYGGQLAPPTVTQTRWYLADLEAAEHAADAGDLSAAARLMLAARRDGVYSGVLSTRTGGLVRLPKRFRGDPEVIAALEVGHDETRSVFEEMFPSPELALIAKDGFELGVGVGELVPVEGRDYPVFTRLNPEFLVYRWTENRWYYRSFVGMIPIVPGDGRWVLHVPGGRQAPWQNAAWKAIGQSYIRKSHAKLYKDSWEGKLANPARVAVAPQGATEPQKESFFRRVMAWGVNTVFGLTPGYDVKLLESNGRGHESFSKTIEEENAEMTIAVAGQTVTTDGGAGFQNSDIHKTIRADLIKETADGLAFTINTQGLPQFIVQRWGEEMLISGGCVVEWDVTPPKDRNSEASALISVANAITLLRAALEGTEHVVDVAELCSRFGVPVHEVEAEAARSKSPVRLAA